MVFVRLTRSSSAKQDIGAAVPTSANKDTPYLILHGEADQVVVAENVSSHMPNDEEAINDVDPFVSPPLSSRDPLSRRSWLTAALPTCS